MNPSNAYDAVHRGSGDIMSVRSISEEPRDKKQAYYSRSSVSLTSSFQKDEMFELHNTGTACKEYFTDALNILMY